MDAERLDGILMDHVLGGGRGSVEDFRALVEACAERDGEVRRKLEGWRGIAVRAKESMAGEAVVLPAFPRLALERTARRSRGVRVLAWGAGMAACVVAGFFLGHGTSPSAVPDAGGTVAMVVPKAAAPAAPERVAAVSDFWSVRRLRANAQTPRPSRAAPSFLSMFEPSIRFGE